MQIQILNQFKLKFYKIQIYYYNYTDSKPVRFIWMSIICRHNYNIVGTEEDNTGYDCGN